MVSDAYAPVVFFQVTAFVCGLLSVILLIVSLSCTAWLETDGTREGLWEKCDRIGDDIDCRKNEYKGKISVPCMFYFALDYCFLQLLLLF